ncbi:MAG: glycoside hydrolase family 5 protein [Candidatus Lokiarchaeota archaeon]|nr:glycoside hydrolase family 5 protein [Candidatus Lokiarchaeota archaeon]
MVSIKLYGVNIGGFLSQTEDYSLTSVSKFITVDDFRKIRDWGFNTIRLAVDFSFLFTLSENNADSLSPIPSNFEYLDHIVSWAEELGLYLIIDLHKAPGHSFESSELHKNRIWKQNSPFQDIFLRIWTHIAQRYHTYENALFDILNEPVAPTAEDWNYLAEKTVKKIRLHTKTNWIVIESNLWGKCKTFPQLRKFDDENIIYSFHFYEPMSVTHQKAEWLKFTREYHPDFVSYPGKTDTLSEALEKGHDADAKGLMNMFRDSQGVWDMTRLESRMQPVFEFQQKHNVPILCGEFGCIAYAHPKTRQNWLSDLMTLFHKNDISYTYWNYKNMHFGLCDYTVGFQDNPNYDENRMDQASIKILSRNIY